MSSLESQFSREVRKDLISVYGLDIHVELVPNMIRTGKKVYDFYFNYNDHFSGVELKRVDGHTFNLNKIEPHQPESLKGVNRSGGTGLFLICFNTHKTSFIFTPETLEIIELQLQYRKSLKIDVFRQFNKVYEMERKKIEGKTRWHVERLVDAAFNL